MHQETSSKQSLHIIVPICFQGLLISCSLLDFLSPGLQLRVLGQVNLWSYGREFHRKFHINVRSCELVSSQPSALLAMSHKIYMSSTFRLRSSLSNPGGLEDTYSSHCSTQWSIEQMLGIAYFNAAIERCLYISIALRTSKVKLGFFVEPLGNFCLGQELLLLRPMVIDIALCSYWDVPFVLVELAF